MPSYGGILIMKQQFGFTLVELMISMVIGLLITAAAIQLYITAQKNIAIQQGAANLQNSASFGLEYMLRNIRLANLNSGKPIIDPSILHGGVVLNKVNLSTNSTFQITGADAGNNLMTAGNVGPSNLQGLKSDQLVIQYRNTVNNRYNCEGTEIAPNVYVIERYFLRADTKVNNDPNTALALACKATTYSGDNDSKLDNLNGNGEIIIPRVDHLHILLGVASDTIDATKSPAATGQDGVLDRFGYISIPDYLALVNKPQIVSLQLGMLVRSPDRVGNNGSVDPNKSYQIFGLNKPLIANSKNNLYMRQVVTQTVALRNGFGIQELPR